MKMQAQARKTAAIRRRSPVQKRSQATVNAILEATAQVLVEHGYAKASTNKIARRAGVSIGTVYEYFPDKDAVVMALLDALVRETLERLQKEMALLLPESLPVATRRWLRMAVGMMRERRELVRTIVEQVPRWDEVAPVRDVERKMIEFSRTLARDTNRHFASHRNLEAALFLVSGMIRAAVLRIVLEKPDHLTEDELIDELADIVTGYYEYTRNG